MYNLSKKLYYNNTSLFEIIALLKCLKCQFMTYNSLFQLLQTSVLYTINMYFFYFYPLNFFKEKTAKETKERGKL